LVADDPYSVGFISLGLVPIGEKPVKAIRIGGVEATRENVINGSYSLYRSFLFVAREEPEASAMEFINFILSPAGQKSLSDEGLIPE
jgi:phosphate transport system substrate-binding protein